MEKKISVIMPVFNAERFLEESLDAFFSQTIADECELICIDDGSTDSSAAILDKYACKHGNMTVLHQSNAGSGPARNSGIDIACGRFVSFLDSDDLYPCSDVLETMFDIAIERRFKVVGGSIEILDSNGRSRFKADGPFGKYHIGQTFQYDCVMEFSSYQFEYGYYRFIFDRRMLNESGIRFPRLWRFQDPGFFVRALNEAGSFYALRKETYTYRWTPDRVSWNYKKAHDVIVGILDLGCFAESHNLKGLYENAVHRLCDEFDPIFREVIVGDKDATLLVELYDARKKLMECGRKIGMNADEFFSDSMVIQESINAISDLEECKIELKARTDELEELRQEFEKLQVERDSLEESVSEADKKKRYLENQVLEMKNSKTWKVGCIIASPFRKARDLKRRIFDKTTD